MSVKADPPLSDAQARALAVLARGPVHAGNEHGITFVTIRSLERRGLCAVTVSARTETNSWGRTVSRRDWVARRYD